MNYQEYYSSKEYIKNSDSVTKEAFDIISTMYETHWGRKDNKGCLTEGQFPIVYAFILAENLRRCIFASNDYKKAIKKETDELWHLSTKKKSHEVEWVFQRNTILGILYYRLAFHEGIGQEVLDCIEQSALKVKLPIIHSHVKNPNGMLFFNVFKDAVRKKSEKQKEQKTEEIRHKKNLATTNGIQAPSPNAALAQELFIKTFREGLDMEKISNDLEMLLEKKQPSGKTLFSQQRHWYIVYQWFKEIKFFTKERAGKDFREWTIAMYGKRGKSSEYDFSEAKKIFKGEPSSWKLRTKYKDYTDIRDYLSKAFNKEKRNIYVIDGRFIDWKLKTKA